MANYAVFACTTYLGTFACASSQMASQTGLAIARRRNLSGAISAFAVVQIADLAA